MAESEPAPLAESEPLPPVESEPGPLAESEPLPSAEPAPLTESEPLPPVESEPVPPSPAEPDEPAPLAESEPAPLAESEPVLSSAEPETAPPRLSPSAEPEPAGQTQLAELVPPAERTPPPRLSPSGAGTYQQCPRRWRFRYIDGLPDPPGEDALVGSFAHRVLELLMQRPPSERTHDSAKAIARQEWPDVEADPHFEALGLDDKGSRAFRWTAWQAIEGLWKLEDPSEVVVAATELDVEAELGGVPFRGIVDRLEQSADGLVVTDYKSGKPPGRGYGRERLDQVLLYAAAVAETTGEMPVHARLYYIGRRGRDKVGIDVKPENIDGVVAKLADTWHAIGVACAADDFEPRVGPLCAWCAYADRCPEGQAEIAKRAERSARRDEQFERHAAAIAPTTPHSAP